MKLSEYLNQRILQALFKKEPMGIEHFYVSLHSGDPQVIGDAEISGRGYKRQPVQFTVDGDKYAENAKTLDFTNMPSASVVAIGIWDDVTAGNYLFGGPVAVEKITNDGDIYRIRAGWLDVTFAP